MHDPSSRRTQLNPGNAFLGLAKALFKSEKKKGLGILPIFHYDQGSPYCSYQFQELLSSVGFCCSMSRRGQCWNNAVAESFWSILKRECLPLNRKFTSRKEGISKISNWLSYYNGFRPHSALGLQSPYQYRKKISV